MPLPNVRHNTSTRRVGSCIIGRIRFVVFALSISVFAWNLFFSDTYDFLSLFEYEHWGFDQTQYRTDYAADSTDSQLNFDVYQPASSEAYIIKNADKLGFDPKNDGYAAGCDIWTNKSAAPEIYYNLKAFLPELEKYNRLLNAVPVLADNRKRLAKDPKACDALKLHRRGLMAGIFKKSRQLSWTPTAGYIEPLFTPLRHPASLCNLPNKKHYLDTTYLILDYEYMCRKLKPHSRTVFLDMGASLAFHGHEKLSIPPPVQVYNKYRRLGFHFDHIYAFELKPENTSNVFKVLPREYMRSFHWMNIGVNASKTSSANPLYNILLEEYTPDDFIVVKLDIDTSEVELALVQQLIDDPRFHNLIDVFYFEHHVKLKEIAERWGKSAKGSVKNSLLLFHKLRELNIPAHYWI